MASGGWDSTTGATSDGRDDRQQRGAAALLGDIPMTRLGGDSSRSPSSVVSRLSGGGSGGSAGNGGTAMDSGSMAIDSGGTTMDRAVESHVAH